MARGEPQAVGGQHRRRPPPPPTTDFGRGTRFASTCCPFLPSLAYLSPIPSLCRGTTGKCALSYLGKNRTRRGCTQGRLRVALAIPNPHPPAIPPPPRTSIVDLGRRDDLRHAQRPLSVVPPRRRRHQAPARASPGSPRTRVAVNVFLVLVDFVRAGSRSIRPSDRSPRTPTVRRRRPRPRSLPRLVAPSPTLALLPSRPPDRSGPRGGDRIRGSDNKPTMNE